VVRPRGSLVLQHEMIQPIRSYELMTRDQVGTLPFEGSDRCVRSVTGRAAASFEEILEGAGPPCPTARIFQEREAGGIGHG
jgi:hypothetical protein